MNDTFEAFWQIVTSVWSSAVFGVGIGSIIVALGIFVVFLLLRGVFARFVIGFLVRLAKRTSFAFPSTSVYLEKLPFGTPEVFPHSPEGPNIES